MSFVFNIVHHVMVSLGKVQILHVGGQELNLYSKPTVSVAIFASAKRLHKHVWVKDWVL